MFRKMFVTFAFIGFVSAISTPAAQANELQHVAANISAIERDMHALQVEAGRLFHQMNQARWNARWHAQREAEKRAEMSRAGCSQRTWYCDALYQDMSAHAQLKQQWHHAFETNQRNHKAVAWRIGTLNQTGQWWKNRLAMLQHQQMITASQPTSPAQGGKTS